MNGFRKGWRLLYTKPQFEKKVFARLTNVKVQSFLPTTKRMRTWHDRRKYIDQPLFPSYVFIYLNDMRDYYMGVETDGVLYYVRTGKEIALVSDSLVNNIKLVSEKNLDVEVSDQRFQKGQQIVVSQGPFAGLSCEVIKYDNKQKLVVKVDILKRDLLIALPESNFAYCS
jgi:transcriptional antiterminator RfaH